MAGVRGKIVLWTSLILILTASLTAQRVGKASPDTKVYVNPSLTVKDKPPADFNINVTVLDVPSDHGVYAWEFKLRFDPNILFTDEDITPAMITEGDFLSKAGSTYLAVSISGGIMTVGCMLLEPVTASGSGTLATIKFQVEKTGKCALDLYATRLIEEDLETEVSHTVEDGFFQTTYPRAEFIYYTEAHPSQGPGKQPIFKPVVNELITFNATSISLDGTYGGSYDPDGTIVNYAWDFGDGTSSTGVIVTRAYSEVGTYTINLTVTDNAALTDSKSKSLNVVIHDIAVINVEVHPAIIRSGELATIEITVLNEGTEYEYFNVTCYYDSTAIWYNKTLNLKGYSSPLIWDPVAKMYGIALQPNENMTVAFTWNTTGVQEGTYTILTNASLVDSTAKFVPGEIDIGDNNKTAPNILVTWGAPVADFTFSPEHPMVDETVTFDASPSNDINGWIASYTWNFGDGNITTVDNTTIGTYWIITHSYSNAATYKVTLNVTDNKGLNGTNIQSVTVSIHDITIISVSVSPTTVRIGDFIFISVAVKNEGGLNETFNVTAYCDSNVIETRINVTLEAGTDTTVTFTWNTTGISVGDYTIKAEASVVSGEIDTADNIKVDGTVTIEKAISTITISASPTTIKVGESIIINGSITPTREGATVTILYRIVGETWDTLAVVITYENSQYSYNWKYATAGTYEVKTSWEGDLNTLYESDVETINVKVEEWPPNIYLYVVVGLALVASAAILIYFLKFRKP